MRVSAWLSHDCSPFVQFVKYGIVGVLATGVQTAIFYLLAATLLPCLGPNDWAVRLAHLPAAEIADDVRAFRAMCATAAGFAVANVFCWALNRLIVFKPGKYAWYLEFAYFFGAALFATIVALATMNALIRYFGLMTTLAVVVEIIVSFAVNFFVRKFVIFKG